MKLRSKIFLLIAALVLLFFLNTTLIGAKIRERVFSLAAPVSRSFILASSLKSMVASPFKMNNILNEKNKLSERLVALEEEVIALRAENEDLKKAAVAYQFSKRRGFNIISANVLGQVQDSTSNSFIIDQGRSAGISENQIVISGDGVLVGKIIRVEEGRAFFLFLTDERARFTAAVSSNSGAIGEVRGRLGSSLTLELIPREIEIKVNDLIVTAGLESGVPRGLLIGRVLEVLPGEASPLQRALLGPAAELSDLRVVSIIHD